MTIRLRQMVEWIVPVVIWTMRSATIIRVQRYEKLARGHRGWFKSMVLPVTVDNWNGVSDSRARLMLRTPVM